MLLTTVLSTVQNLPEGGMSPGSIALAPRFILAEHHLAQVLCQIQFSPILRLREEDSAIPFQEEIRRRYPRYSRQGSIGFIVTPQGVQPQPEGPPLHRFDGSDGFAITLGTDFVALETRAYEKFEDFVSRLIEVVSLVATIYEPPEMPRIGLRFVNELRLPVTDMWEEMRLAINPVLLGVGAASELDGVIEQLEQVVLVRSDGDQRMLIRHGLMPHGGSTVQSPLPVPDPAVLQQPYYLIDIDAFEQSEMAFNPSAVEDRVLRFNDDIRSFFAWAVPEDYRRSRLGQKELK